MSKTLRMLALPLLFLTLQAVLYGVLRIRIGPLPNVSGDAFQQIYTCVGVNQRLLAFQPDLFDEACGEHSMDYFSNATLLRFRSISLRPFPLRFSSDLWSALVTTGAWALTGWMLLSTERRNQIIGALFFALLIMGYVISAIMGLMMWPSFPG